MRRLAMICRSDKSGLGVQTHRVARLLQPNKIMLIDSSRFNSNLQYPEKYKEYDYTIVRGFPTDDEITQFLRGVDIVYSAETFYSIRFTTIARDMNVKTIGHLNPEFADWFKPEWARYPLPDKVVVPSLWMIDTMRQWFNAQYLPTPIFDDEFADVRESNLNSITRNFLFMNGKTAAEDRNGLESLYRALEIARGDFTVTIKAQDNIKRHPDPRIIYDFTNPDDQRELYKGYDCLVQPRRYGGQSLSMTEALTCAMPVIMTDIDPNNKVLPKEWLVSAEKKGELMTRFKLDVYEASAAELAYKLDSIDLGTEAKKEAVELSRKYSADNLEDEYRGLIE